MVKIVERVANAAEDDELFLALYAEGREAETAAFGWPPEALAAFLRMQFRLQQSGYARCYPGAEHNLLLLDGEVLGQWRVQRAAREIVLVDIALISRVRGRGIGSSLIRRLCRQAARQGVPVHLSVRPESRARALYQRLGFVETRGDQTCVAMTWAPPALDGGVSAPAGEPRRDVMRELGGASRAPDEH